jgi:UDP-N-acetylmuramyl pentapeptide phosphotransferase/UDP-N-acetylglucosamine-1-phosphate transferase
MSNMSPSPFLSFIVAYGVLHWVNTRPNAIIPIDRPNSRSLHTTPVPRVGGVGLLAGVAISGVALDFPFSTTITAGGLLLACVSLGDDYFGVPVIGRLTTHLCAAGLVASDLFYVDYGLFASLLAMLVITWGANLYNFMDGSDGLAGGMAMFGFTFYAIAAFASGNEAFGWANASIATAAGAFLIFNFHPARIFLGDVGSIPLGFLASCLGLVGWSQLGWAWWFPILVFSPFIVDASVTLAKRTYARAGIWQAHRDHYYQRLVQLGWGHRRTALAEYLLMFVCGTAAIAGLKWPPFAQLTLLIAATLIYAGLIASIEIAWGNRRKGRLDDC